MALVETSDSQQHDDMTGYWEIYGGEMEKSFEVGDRVIVTGQPSVLFAGETGTILDVTMRREDNATYNVYWVAFQQKRVRMIGLYLKSVHALEARQIC